MSELSQENERLHVTSYKLFFQEFLFHVLPIITLLLVVGFVSAFIQNGFIPNGDLPFPIADVRVPLWHIFWMGLWTGYIMALVGEASGILALPYSMSVLQFTNPAVSPTTQIITFLNPIGALLGFHRNGQWNFDFAKWVCVGGVIGGLIGPYLRVTVFVNTRPFQFLMGLALATVGVYMLHSIVSIKKIPTHQKFLNKGLRIKTISLSRGTLIIGYGEDSWKLSTVFLFLIGAGVGVISSALGVGGGFLLVPIFVTYFRIPIFVVVAATIPYVIVLSAIGLFSYSFLLPKIGLSAINPEWSWGFIAGAGGVLGSWIASKTQHSVPEHFLKFILGSITLSAGFFYIANYLLELQSKL